MGEVITLNGGKVIGFTKKDETCDFETTPKSIINDDRFWGLCLDEDNQPELTQERLQKWVGDIKEEF